MGLYQLIYQSQSLVPFELPELMALLKQCCAYNQAHGITGILLYTPDGRFLQVLEGEQDEVRHLYFNRVLLDPRQVNCQIFGEGPCLHRSFPAWPMGFRLAQARDLRRLLSYVPPDIPGLLVPRRRTRPELLKLLLKLVAHGETDPGQQHPW